MATRLTNASAIRRWRSPSASWCSSATSVSNEKGNCTYIGPKSGLSHLPGGHAVKATLKDGQPRQNAAFGVGEQTPRLLKDLTQAAMPLRHIA